MTTEDISIEYESLTVKIVKVTLNLDEWGALLDVLDTSGLGDIKTHGPTLLLGNHVFVCEETLQ